MRRKSVLELKPRKRHEKRKSEELQRPKLGRRRERRQRKRN